MSYTGYPADGTTTTDGTNITYVPSSGYSGNDQFTFGISDGLGGLATATASVVVNPTSGLNKFTNSTNAGAGNYVLTLSGAAYCNYILQSTPSLSPPVIWTPQETNTADASGLVIFTNQPSGSTAFWRSLLGP